MSIQPVIDLMRQMYTLHEQLIELAAQKQTAIIKNKTDELMKVNKLENKMIKQIQEADHKRRLVVAHYLQSKDFPVQYTITVSEFSKYVFDPNEKNVLLDEQKKLLDILAKLKELNDTNQMLLQEAIKYIDFSIELMTLTGDDGIVYQHPTQQQNQVGRSSIFDSRA